MLNNNAPTNFEYDEAFLLAQSLNDDTEDTWKYEVYILAHCYARIEVYDKDHFFLGWL